MNALEQYSKVSEAELVAKMQQGDELAFSEVITRYEAMVARVVIGMLGNTAEAEDVGQETFIRFWRSIESYRHEAKISTFLTRIAVNLSINELRRRSRRYEQMQRMDDKPFQHDVADSENVFERMDMQELLTQALEKIDYRQRSVVILRMVEGFSTKETAQMFGIPIGTVLSRLSRALDKLKETIKKMEDI